MSNCIELNPDGGCHEPVKQIHHRVKNNLQVICSLLRLQSQYAMDDATRVMFRESEERVRSMALIHERLCRGGDSSQVQFDEYARQLVTQLQGSYHAKIPSVTLNLQLEEVELSIEKAVPCGLLLNELFSNALKYGRSENDQTVIGVNLKDHGHFFELEVYDHGCGIPSSVSLERPNTLGLRLVHALSGQLNATLAVERDNGTHFRLRCSKHEGVPLTEESHHATPEHTHL